MKHTETAKLIALSAMIIDHVGAVLFPDLEALRIIGRAAMPLFALSCGGNVARSRNAWAMAQRIAALGLLTQPAYAAAFDTAELNILATLALGVVAAAIIQAGRTAAAWGLLLGCLATEILAGPIIAGSTLWAAVVPLAYLQTRGHQWIWPLIALWSLAASGSLVGGLVGAAAVLGLWAAQRTPDRPGRLVPAWTYYAAYPGHLAALVAIRYAWL